MIRSRTTSKLLLSLAALVILVGAAAIVVRPYSRLERVAEALFAEYAPPGAVAGEIDLGFPATVTVSGLTLPVHVNGRERRVSFEKLSGAFSIPALLRGKMGAELSGDLFGGILWLKLLAGRPARGLAWNDSSLSIDARARNVDITKLCAFFESPLLISGVCDADIQAQTDGSDITQVKAQGLVLGEQMALPQIPIEKLVLPACRNGRLTAEFEASDGTLTMRTFRFTGSAYDLVGQGILTLTDPPQQGAIEGTFQATFKEPPVVTDRDLVRMGADAFANSLAESKTEIPLRLYGTLEEPRLQLDPASSLGTLLQGLGEY
ncbi:MAG: hypothetical protein Kow0099_12760 [Candidatus Abyssubacteria bacterium]